MKPAIAFAKVPDRHPELGQLLEQFPYAWLEGLSGVRLALRQEIPDWNDLTLWPAGRIFGETGEYRWKYDLIRGELHVVVLLDQDPLPPFLGGQLALEREERDAPLILWGEWVDPIKDPEQNPDGGPIFYAPAIPQSQHYPLQHDKASLISAAQAGFTPRLIIRRYRHCEKGEFSRCVGICMKTEKMEENINGQGQSL